VSRQCSDSLLLAQLAHAEGDDTTAIDLVSKLDVCRLAPTIHCARLLALQLGVAEQRARDEQECIAPQNAAEHGPFGVRRVMATLRAELGRRGWLEPRAWRPTVWRSDCFFYEDSFVIVLGKAQERGI
jgi:hypothetical protein